MNWSARLINPVLEKEFRLRMRSVRASFAVLFYLIAMALLAFGFMYVNLRNYGSGSFNPQRSQELFSFLSGAQLVLISFMTPGLTAGVISGEREKQTLNILLTTQQSSMTIIFSKLMSSLSFMLLVIIATLPIYSIVFLYGGISPQQVMSVFGFYIFMMLLLGTVGVFFSTIFKKTMIAVIMTYGFTMFIFAFTGLLAIFIQQVMQRNNGQSLIFAYILSLNPLAALIGIISPDFTRSVFNNHLHLQLWYFFVPVYTIVLLLMLWLSVRYLRPRLRKR